MPEKVIMPKLGEFVVDGTVTRWIKHEGDKVQEYEFLLEVETAKVTTEIPSPSAGIVLKIVVPEGETVDAGVILAWIGQEGESIPEAAAGPAALKSPAAKVPSAQGTVLQAVGNESPSPKKDLGFISPVVAKLAGENGIDLTKLEGTGEHGRITKKDVMEYLQAKEAQPGKTAEPAPWETPGSGDLFKPTEDFQKAPPAAAPASPAPASDPGLKGDTLLPLTPRRKAIADHMILSRDTSVHVTTVMEADLSRVMIHKNANRSKLEQDGIKLTYTPYFAAAVAAALMEHPMVNSSWTEKGILIHRDVNIGVAVSLGEDGLIVPVIRQADHLSLTGLATAINDLASRARSKRLLADETSGGTFSITNHGVGKSLFATPVINQPQCAILGVGAITKRVVVIQDAIAIRPMVFLSLSFDHRILDGASADAFLGKVVDILEAWQ